MRIRRSVRARAVLGACHPGEPRGGPGHGWARRSSATLSPAAAGWISGGNAFAFDLYHRQRDDPGDLFLSPRSVRRALAMLSAGAAGATADEMARALRFAPLTGAAVHAAQAESDAYLASGTGRRARLLLAAAHPRPDRRRPPARQRRFHRPRHRPALNHHT